MFVFGENAYRHRADERRDGRLGDEIMAARMPDSREGVVFAHDADGWAVAVAVLRTYDKTSEQNVSKT